MLDGDRRIQLHHRGRTNSRRLAHRLYVQKDKYSRTKLYYYRKGDDGNNIRSPPIEKISKNIKKTNDSNYRLQELKILQNSTNY
jgi:hypothetical protein